MKKIFLFITLLMSCCTFAQNVGIGTTTPAATGKLHVHDGVAFQDASIVLTNSLTGPSNLRGARFRLINSDLGIINNEATGKINFAINFNTRMTIDATGNVGVGTLTPGHKLDIVNTDNTNGINIAHSGTGVQGLDIDMGIAPNNTGVRIYAPYNAAFPNYSTGLHAISGNGPTALTPNENYGVIGESRNISFGIGVMGISNSPSPLASQGGVYGINFSAAAEAYGVVGYTNSIDGAAVAGKTNNTSSGLLGLSVNTPGSAIKGECIGTSSTAIELKNGAIRVSGTNRTVFQITAQTGVNIVGNLLVIPNTTLANKFNDLLIVTPYFTSVYLNKPIGVWWDGNNWNIFTQDLSAMPNNAAFNVLVAKQ